jgi:hypothetical protein
VTASSIETDVRGAMATALASVTANVYNHVPEAIIAPAVVIVPDSPYMELNLINKSTIKVMLNYTVTVAVAYNSNPGSLDNLEKLIMEILAAIPAGWSIGTVERPTVTQVGASNLLVADIRVSTQYEQTN